MSIKIKDRIELPAASGIPCERCIKIERLRQLIADSARYLNAWFTNEDEIAFYKLCAKQAVKEAYAIYERKTQKQKKSITIKSLIKSRLRSLWRKEKVRLLRGYLRSQRLHLLEKELTKLVNEHPKCAACKICFGGYHIETPHDSPIGNLCSVCAKDYRKQGHKKFISRINAN